MKLLPCDIVFLNKDIPELGLTKGQRGVILDVPIRFITTPPLSDGDPVIASVLKKYGDPAKLWQN
ncbi:DUF4926 domain-containing protein [Pantoea alhagi]|uniref:DUF4926 domain-containing protein n=1 Tax=Pantoea alhagi TaxID=1891675 RepID=UPI00202AEA2F|nr:DUF4926 domain-containing protein [Pantoea alhagi]URQ59591.1 DUF4926 domain-containing protein [Pantoea alhagi]